MPARKRAETPTPSERPPGSNAGGSGSGGGHPSGDGARPSKLLGPATFLLNAVAVVSVGLGVHRVEVLQGSYLNLPGEVHDVTYGTFLLAACPRCALVSRAARNESSGLCDIARLFGENRSWAKWTFAPGIYGLHCAREALEKQADFRPQGLRAWLRWTFGAPADVEATRGARPLLAKLLYAAMVITMIHDSVFFLALLRSLCEVGFGSMLRMLGAYVAKYAIVWALSVFYFWCYDYYFAGAHRLLLLILIAVLFVTRTVGLLAMTFQLFTGNFGKESDAAMMMSGVAPLMTSLALFWEPYSVAIASIPGNIVVFATLATQVLVVSASWRAPGVLKFAVNMALVAQLVDLALAELFLLETLRHKTGIGNWLSINLQGLLASRGGSAAGGESAFGARRSAEIRGQVYVWKDSFIGIGPHLCTCVVGNPKDNCDCLCTVKNVEEKVRGVHVQGLLYFPFRAAFGNLFAFTSGRSSFYKDLTGEAFHDYEGKHWLAWLGGNIWGGVVVAIPSIKFRCRLDDLASKRLRADPKLQELAWFTDHDLPPHWIGFVGTFYHGFWLLRSGKFLAEVRRAPLRALAKFTMGVGWLALAIAWFFLVDEWNSIFAFFFLMYL